MKRRNFLTRLLAVAASPILGKENQSTIFPIKDIVPALKLDYLQEKMSGEEASNKIKIDGVSLEVDILEPMTAENFYIGMQHLRREHDFLRCYEPLIAPRYISYEYKIIHSKQLPHLSKKSFKNLRRDSIVLVDENHNEKAKFFAFNLLGTEGRWYVNNRLYRPGSLLKIKKNNDYDIRIIVDNLQAEYAGIDEVLYHTGIDNILTSIYCPSSLYKEKKC